MQATLKSWRDAYLNALAPYWGADEARSLFFHALSHVADLGSTALHVQPERILPPAQQEHLEAILKRLENGEPLQYITGVTSFFGLEISCAPAALIPRPETEELAAMCAALPMPEEANMADLGTGTGCLALALKKAFPLARVTGYDISPEALELARVNAKKNRLTVGFEELNILDPLGFADLKPLDLLVSNPPYVAPTEAADMRPHVLKHEPHLALFTKREPLEFYRALAEIAQAKLKPGGWVTLEINPLFAGETLSLFHVPGMKATLRHDMFGKERFVLAQKTPT